MTSFLLNRGELRFRMRICDSFVAYHNLFTSFLLQNFRGKRKYETNVEETISYGNQGPVKCVIYKKVFLCDPDNLFGVCSVEMRQVLVVVVYVMVHIVRFS